MRTRDRGLNLSQIDLNDLNNSFTAEPHGKPARKLENYWLFMTQWAAQALAWWAV